jgi:hypothetical protein
LAVIITVFVSGNCGPGDSTGTEIQPKAAAKPGKEVNVDTGYWVINDMDKFYIKVTKVTFNHPATGTKKPEAGKQIVGIEYSAKNPAKKELKISRGSFTVKGAELDHFGVESSYPLVVKADPGQAITFSTYHIIDESVQDLKGLTVVVAATDENYVNFKVRIPLEQKKKKEQ